MRTCVHLYIARDRPFCPFRRHTKLNAVSISIVYFPSLKVLNKSLLIERVRPSELSESKFLGAY